MIQIKEWRKESGITQKQLAEASGLDLRWIQKLESGEISIENITVKKFIQLIKGMCDISESVGSSASLDKAKDAYVWMSTMLAGSR